MSHYVTSKRIIDVTHAEAFLVRQEADAGDIFVVDTSTPKVSSLADVVISATKKLYLDTGGDSYLHEESADDVEILVGGSIKLKMEHGILTSFPNDAVDIVNALTAGSVASDTTVSGTTITASVGFALGDGDYVGITSNEILTFNTAGTIVATGITDFILDNTGASVNSPNLVLRGDDGGVEQEATLHLVQGADPYLRISVDDDNTTPALTAVIDIHDTVIAFVTDNTVDIGATGANRPKDIFLSGDITVGDDVILADGAVVGIAGNEVITFNAVGTIVVSGAILQVDAIQDDGNDATLSFSGTNGVDVVNAFTAGTISSDATIVATTTITAGSNYVLEGYATGRNVLRCVNLLIQNATDANKIKMTVIDRFNGAAIGVEDNLQIDVAGTNYIYGTGAGANTAICRITGGISTPIAILSSEIYFNGGLTDILVDGTVQGTSLQLSFTNATTGAAVIIDDLVDNGNIGLIMIYVSSS